MHKNPHINSVASLFIVVCATPDRKPVGVGGLVCLLQPWAPSPGICLKTVLTIPGSEGRLPCCALASHLRPASPGHARTTVREFLPHLPWHPPNLGTFLRLDCLVTVCVLRGFLSRRVPHSGPQGHVHVDTDW